MAYDIAELKKNVSRVKIKFMQTKNTTFFSALLANLDLQITEEGFPPGLETACTNGIYLKLHPKFIAALSLDALMGLILHEVLHVAFDHILRCFAGKLNHKIYNIAADHYINLLITDMGYILPPGGYCDTKYKGMSTQQIYNILIKDPPPDTKDFTPDIMPNDPKKMTADVHKMKVTANIVKAITQAQIANDPGSVPGEITRKLDKILNPQLPWQQILQRFMEPYKTFTSTWSRPNRRYQPAEIYLPSNISGARIKQITGGADVSYSMSKNNLTDIGAELNFIWTVLQPEKMRLQTFDTQVHLDEIYTEGDTLELLEWKGGGGTNIVPLIESIKKEKPELALIFTDGKFRMPDLKGITTHIIWVINNNKGFKKPLIGDVIQYDQRK